MAVVSMSKQEFSRLDVLLRVQSGHTIITGPSAPDLVTVKDAAGIAVPSR
jgi:hypothetical protein